MGRFMRTVWEPTATPLAYRVTLDRVATKARRVHTPGGACPIKQIQQAMEHTICNEWGQVHVGSSRRQPHPFSLNNICSKNRGEGGGDAIDVKWFIRRKQQHIRARASNTTRGYIRQ
jgi:hypothetical protein